MHSPFCISRFSKFIPLPSLFFYLFFLFFFPYFVFHFPYVVSLPLPFLLSPFLFFLFYLFPFLALVFLVSLSLSFLSFFLGCKSLRVKTFYYEQQSEIGRRVIPPLGESYSGNKGEGLGKGREGSKGSEKGKGCTLHANSSIVLTPTLYRSASPRS